MGGSRRGRRPRDGAGALRSQEPTHPHARPGGLPAVIASCHGGAGGGGGQSQRSAAGVEYERP
eukprot:7004148-Pyramimonas_sp.AAC.1